MCLKQSFSHSKWVLPAILSLTVFSNWVSDSSSFDTAFLPDCSKCCGVFSCYWIGNLMRIPKWAYNSHKFNTVFETRRVSGIYDSYFNNYHGTV